MAVFTISTKNLPLFLCIIYTQWFAALGHIQKKPNIVIIMADDMVFYDSYIKK